MKILFCKSCWTYTLKDSCSSCNKKTSSIKPAKFSPEDKFGEWRRIYKTKQKLI